MTCDQCNGSGRFPLINPWEMKKMFKAKNYTGKPLPLLRNAPCAECQNDDFMAYVAAMIERHGEPYDDGEISRVTYYDAPDGERFGVLQPKGARDADDQETN